VAKKRIFWWKAIRDWN